MSAGKNYGNLICLPNGPCSSGIFCIEFYQLRLIFSRRGILVDFACSICGEDEETFEHLFFHCIFSKHIWKGSSLGLDFENEVPCL